MIAAGTGVAPFRGFIRARMTAAAASPPTRSTTSSRPPPGPPSSPRPPLPRSWPPHPRPRTRRTRPPARRPPSRSPPPRSPCGPQGMADSPAHRPRGHAPHHRPLDPTLLRPVPARRREPTRGRRPPLTPLSAQLGVRRLPQEEDPPEPQPTPHLELGSLTRAVASFSRGPVRRDHLAGVVRRHARRPVGGLSEL